MRKFNWQQILIFSAGWILLAFLFSGFGYFSNLQGATPRPFEWKRFFLSQTIIYSWAILSPLIIFFAKRFRFEQRNWWRLLPAHLVAAVVFLLLHAAIYAIFFNILYPAIVAEQGGFLAVTLRQTVNAGDLIVYFFVLSCFYVVDFYRRFQTEQLKSSELKAALATSQLDALKMQIHPHFLFNTLNSVSALIHEDAEAADEMVARLGDFLRTTLENSGDQAVSLKQEMDFVGRYLEIESVRFQDRLSVKMNIDPETLTARVPNLILQPIVENAIKHGVSQQESVGSLIISSERRGDRLQIRIEDSGPGLKPSNGNGNGSKPIGIGLANTRARLAHLYEENYQFEIKNAVSHGVIVTLEIPFETIKGLQPETEQVEIK
ncbi:MAG TPA: histidine kinase [Pyrinomonadaceae bacterium]|nr:histidine kinase [Pyrinomonadaceae bacterium]